MSDIRTVGRLTRAMLLLLCLAQMQFPASAQTSQDDAKAKQTERNELYLRAAQLRRGGKSAEAIPLAQKIVATDEEHLGRLHRTTLNSCRFLGMTLIDSGRLESADDVLRDLVKRYEELHDESHPELIQTLTDLGALQVRMNKIARSESFHRHAIALSVRAGRKDLTKARALSGMGMYFLAMKEPSRALTYFLEARKASLESETKDALNYASILNNISNCNADLGKVDQSIRDLEEARTILRTTVGEDHPRYLTVIKNQGVLYLQAGRLDEAKRLMKTALELNQKHKGVDSLSNADFLLDLGQVVCAQGDLKEAEDLFRRGRQMLTANPDHTQMARALRGLVEVLQATGRVGAAFELQTQILEFQQSDMEPILSVGSEQGMAQFFQSVHGSLEHLCCLASALQSTDNQAAAVALTWVLRRKAVISDIIYHFREQEGAAYGDPSVAGLVNRLQSIRKELARLALRPDAEENPDQRALIRNLEFQSDQAERDLHRKISAYKRKQTQPFHKVSLDDLRKKMAPESVLIECLSMRIRNLDTSGKNPTWGPPHYFAFVLHAGEDIPVQMVDLGPTADVDKAIKAFRTKYEETPRELRGSDEKTVEEDFRKVSNELYEQIFARLRPHLGQAKLIYLAPDGQLCQIPYEALADKEDKYLLESYRIAYLITGRDLVRPRLKRNANMPTVAGQRPGGRAPSSVARGNLPQMPRPGVPSNSPGRNGPRPNGPTLPPGVPGNNSARQNGPGRIDSRPTSGPAVENNGRVTEARGVVVFAGPDFNLKPSAAFPPGAAAARNLPADAPAATRAGTAIDTRGLRWEPLAGAAAEAEDIRNSRVGRRFGPVKTFVGPEAREEILKQMPPPGLLHIATHGFFLPDKPKKEMAPGKDDSDENRGGVGLGRLRGMHDPMRRSGIVLAGANAAEEALKLGMEDGWVTAEEISLLNLRGTDLVVLSACESGLGDVRLGDGVSGLRRAFLHAGARSLVTSLFEVPDVETRALMKHFYEELGNGTKKLEALHAAKVALRRERFEKNEAAHPFFWASFILIGEPN